MSTVTTSPRRQQGPTPATGPDDWVRHHAVGVWRFLRALGADPQLAEELCHEAFVVAWQKGQAGREPAVQGAFLRSTARHLLLRHRARTLRDAAARQELAAVTAEAERQWQQHCADDDGAGLVAAAAGCVRQLQPRVRRAVELSYRDGCSRTEIAAAMGMQENGVKTMLQRARQWLRRCIEQAEAADRAMDQGDQS